MNELTTRQEAFAQHYVVTGNGAEAARRAGYAPVGARVTACRLLTKANVQAEIAAERRAHERTMGTSREKVAAELMGVVDLARERGDVRGMIAALREIGLICGYYEQPEGANIHPNIAAKRAVDRFETMSDSELVAMVREKGG